MNEKTITILQKVGSLYMKYGIRSVTMDDVARELGISKKTLYEHFQDKDDLVKKFITHHLEAMDKAFRAINRKKITAIEKLLEITDMVNQYMGEFNPSITFDLRKYHPEAWAILLQYKSQQVLINVKENLLQGIEEGLYRSDMNPEIIARIYVDRIIASMGIDFDLKLEQPFIHVFREIVTYHIRGIASAKGLKLFESIYKKHKLFEDSSI